MRVLICIPARGGSARIPRKNLQSINGETLLARTIWTAQQAKAAVDRGWPSFVREMLLVVSTDDIEACAEAQLHGCESFLRETPGDGPMLPVLQEALAHTERRTPDYAKIDAVMCLQPTSPLREARHILAASAAFTRSCGTLLVSVNQETGERNGAIYMIGTSFLRATNITDPNALWAPAARYPMPAEHSLDINTPADLEEARRILGP